MVPIKDADQHCAIRLENNFFVVSYKVKSRCVRILERTKRLLKM